MKETISKKQLREFGLLIGFGFPLLIGWLLPVLAGHGFSAWTLGVGVISTSIGFLKPKLLCLPYLFCREIWSNFNSLLMNILLSVTYLFLIIPISLATKLLGYDPLKRKLNETNSYRELKHQYLTDSSSCDKT